ncbi:hypothetical protein HMF8227_01592 [Saliniradius amylolyticus]|uniref:PDZ domain-containing protein n=1 Tax=Saliniradius amylolyticus TaxID=2183582 RepID=A0A2S2E327_9ALTE|nr:PDZ domain-containing protein [Saliniradius amylolyticus]AWL12066.1 hypothetical protein HMF8227_01592 [Saliniradius amylolyticus]
MSHSLHYQIRFDDKNHHCYNVQLSVPAHSGTKMILSLPAWIPGSYMIRDFAKNIVQLNANDDAGEALDVIALDKQRWQVMSSGQAFTLEYQVYAFDTSVRTAYLDNERAFFNGTSLFLQVEGFEDQPHRVTVDGQSAGAGWKVATGLPRLPGTDKYDFGDYQADNYAHLIDCPMEISDFDAIEFSVFGVPHHMILSGRHYADKDRLAKDVTKLCEHHIRLFSGKQAPQAPFDEYWFLTNILPQSFGGLEHKNSTALLCSTFDFPNPNKPEETSDNYQTLLSLIAHEYFHAWNVCRIKPKEFIPYQLDQESHTEQLWAYEGFTSYYDDFSLYRAGIIGFEDYLKLLSKTLTRVFRGQGETKQSVTQSSFYAWTKFYKQAEDAPDNIVSYYTKGAMIALWLDLSLRLESQGTISMDDMMRGLWREFGQKGVGTAPQDFIDMVRSLAGDKLAKELTELLYQAERLDLTALLGKVGVKLQKLRASLTSPTTIDEQRRCHPGFTFKPHAKGLEVTTVAEGSPAALAGINAEDVIIAVDTMAVSTDNLALVLDHQPQDASIPVHLFRDNVLKQMNLVLSQTPPNAIALEAKDPALANLWQQVIEE